MLSRREFGPIDGLEDGRGYRSIYVGDRQPVDDELIFEAAMAASRRLLETERPIDEGDDVRVRRVFVAVLGREPSEEESSWAVEVIGRAGSLAPHGVLGAMLRPDKIGEQAAYLESRLPKVTVQTFDGEGVVPWAMLYHALMSTSEFRQLR